MKKRFGSYQYSALNVSVFVCGAVLMIFELVGSRMFAPFLGTSTYVWTSLIGVILGFLSLGYWYGGKLADKKTSFATYAKIIFCAAASILVVFFIQSGVLFFFKTYIQQIELSAVLSAIVLFAPASFLLGIVSPYAVRLKLEHLENSASTIGTLYAISTAGSIFGTFFGGFFLIPRLGTAENLLLLSGVLALVPLLFLRSKKSVIVTAVVIGLIASSYTTHTYFRAVLFQKFHFIDVDSEYSRIRVSQSKNPKNGKEQLNLTTDPFATESAMYLTDDELVFDYTKFYHLDAHFKPNIQSALMLGGCAYSYPKDFLRNYPSATMDVVEIDPLMTELAKKYFRLTDNPRLTTYHEDGRMFLNRNTKQYDVIYGDAFNAASSIPFQLTTKEAVQHQFNALNADGVVLANIISAIDGKRGKFLRAQYATYKSIFPQVYLFPITDRAEGTQVQNVLLVALKSQTAPKFTSTNTELNGYLAHRWMSEVKNDLPILTDNFAPVDYYKRESF
ncbi:hypothetical protein A3C09_02295 [Candidatus Uhrbacteria bacterium RIFCSPHIGHO2_02_FULL_47_44]|uniref:PABS domain-containing protein n=1 Tax=Candidatus Uhrbacteria bacterium RIFCSPLOWO2_02_FULL_48_18 TaxID=1802408 RepID=A0A1F7V7C5_9BACT|nr:MAG: hypothetical protein A2839_01485 [Candidatus Uhrbacteria bacterium RIFCSPHIGHO2_01_FULL_47_10]OGL71217.1 MAG: hypothetical protein A3C09_02295 [Candidatus Uhrbacteria bacterium RIFCSPHIGHO2_02_FULL_47_44]OGL80826.1 MAG: hypothetical protein A3B20_03680 [Candidatus Uhrbacteria bacterium RIFCSPLOWO2_01_FULL_47_17]OGL86389.1 MAG: hypothetical protein A3I41_02160 [Candidatus Uhrbacteria bacterium RIFCSPLOWO2_02_FULL_48_18]OGL93088.1 MAG: hypothetical protein A3H12_01355 [Candidatus Uhrbacte